MYPRLSVILFLKDDKGIRLLCTVQYSTGNRITLQKDRTYILKHKLTSYTIILAVTLQGTTGYMGCDSAEHRGQRLEQ